MKKMSFIALLLLVLLFSFGCTEKPTPRSTPEETATTTVEPAKPMEALKIESLENLPKDMIPFGIHPTNPSIVYCMRYTDTLKDNRVLIGSYSRKVAVFELNIGTGTQKKLLSEANFITLAKWSYDGKYLGMVSGETLLLYNFEKGEIDNVNELVNTPSVIYFGWSPDSKTIYTEHANLPNDSIYDVENKIGTPSYQVTERKPYFKDRYNDGLYMGTAEISDTWGNRKPVTVTLDEKGNVVQMIGEGRYRDEYAGQLIQVGTEHFGLIYYPDLEKLDAKPYTGEYVYQTAFTPQGDFVYTTKGEDDLGIIASYQLKIFRKGKPLQTYEVSGPYFSIWPNGKYIDIGGYGEERIDLEQKERFRKKLVLLNNKLDNTDVLNTTIRAADLYTRLYCGLVEDKDIEAQLSQFFINTDEPIRQWAKLDISEEVKHWKTYRQNSKQYHITGELGDIKIDGNRATVTAGFSIQDSGGSGLGFGTTYELLRQEGKWYITGQATFPESKERGKVEKVALDFIKNIEKEATISFNQGSVQLLYNELKGQKLELGQIQFWQMSEPHLASSVEWANYAKVYLHAEERIYKLVLSKSDRASWQAISLSESLLGL